MGKRSSFRRRERDCYDTPESAVLPLLPHVSPGFRFIEPCAGSGALVGHLEKAGLKCAAAFDIVPRHASVEQRDLFDMIMDFPDRVSRVEGKIDGIITNTPWGRDILHRMIGHLRGLALPAWLLIDANWMFTQQAAPYLRYCERIVTVGRVKWIEGSAHSSLDDAAWFLLKPRRVGSTQFFGKPVKEVVRETKAA